MSKLRRRTVEGVNLTNGPAKLCEAFGIGRPENGINLLGNEIYIALKSTQPPPKVVTSTRIGIKNGAEKNWRFYIKENEFVSKR